MDKKKLKLNIRHADCLSIVLGDRVLSTQLWPAVSGAIARQEAVDIVANNLANANTLGFKKDAPTFQEYLATNEKENLTVDIPRGPITDKDLTPLNGRDQSFVVLDSTYTNFEQGHLKVTNNPLDVALDGPGFLEVSTPNGVRYIRQGSLKVNTDGLLVTKEGNPVLAYKKREQEAQPALAVQPIQGGSSTQGGVAAEQLTEDEVKARTINLKDVSRRAALSISEKGEIFNGPDLIAQLSVTEFKDNKVLRKDRDLGYINGDIANIKENTEKTKIQQGMLETSNVNAAEEMTKLIQSHRLYELNLKGMKAYDQMLEKEANEIGRL